MAEMRGQARRDLLTMIGKADGGMAMYQAMKRWRMPRRRNSRLAE